MKYSLIIGIFLFLFIKANYAQTYKRVFYATDDSTVTNPERGFYKYTEVWASSNYNFLDSASLASYRKQGYSLIYRIVYLDSYKSGDISTSFLNNLEKDFGTVRKAGLKIVLRFAYTTNTNYPVGDAPIDIVLRHIAQLKPLLQENSDVIMTLQAGFIGAWGEWYYTDYYSNPNDSANWSLRAKIVAAEMDALPNSRMLQIRYVPFISKLANDTTPLNETEAYSGTLKARLAHHNDCFVADQSNFGTYSNITKDRSYLSRDSKYMVVGGETCNVFSPYSDCPNSTNDLAVMHWTFLNIDYYSAVYDGWKTQGCMNDVWRKLGYRYKFLYSDIQDSSKAAGTFNATIKLINVGYSNPVNPRKVELILRNTSTHEEFYINYNKDIRLAVLNDTITLSFNSGLPMGIPEGNYNLFLNMPDPEVRLYGNPLYSVRMANNNIWESSSGYNKLNAVLIVKNSSNVTTYTGNQYFIPKKAIQQNIHPNPLKSNGFSNNALLYWGVNNRKYFQVLERSKSNQAFEPLATLYPGVISYVDNNLTPDTKYAYRMYLTKVDTTSLLSDTANISLGAANRYFVQIHSNNTIDDWSAIQPVASVFRNDTTYAIRFFNNADSLFILTENLKSARILFKTDSSGLADNWFAGNYFGYLLSNDSLFNVQSNKWSFTKKIYTIKDSDLVEFAISFNDLPIFKKKIDCSVGIESRGILLPDTGLALVTKIIFPKAPQNFTVTNNPYIPNTSLYLSWDNAAGATSYMVERSDGNTSHFIDNQEVSASDNRGPHIDLNLDDNITYYYRVYTINNFFRSEYSDTAYGKPLPLGIDYLSANQTKVFPNPIDPQQTLQIELPSVDNYKIEVYNLYGVKLYISEIKSDNTSIDLAKLKLVPGVYFLEIQGTNNFLKKVSLIIN